MFKHMKRLRFKYPTNDKIWIKIIYTYINIPPED